jgi:hypothetical protein
MLVHLGFGDPLTTQQEVRAENPMLENDIELAHALYKTFCKGEKFSAGTISKLPGSDAYGLMVGPNDRWDAQKAGYRLKGLRDRVLDGLKLISDGHMHGVSFYRVGAAPKEGGVGLGYTDPIKFSKKLTKPSEATNAVRSKKVTGGDRANPTPPLRQKRKYVNE